MQRKHTCKFSEIEWTFLECFVSLADLMEQLKGGGEVGGMIAVQSFSTELEASWSGD